MKNAKTVALPSLHYFHQLGAKLILMPKIQSMQQFERIQKASYIRELKELNKLNERAERAENATAVKALLSGRPTRYKYVRALPQID